MLPKSAHKFAKRLAEYIERESLTGTSAAARLDVAHQRIYAWLAGKNLPPKRQAERLADRMRMPDLPALIAKERKAKRGATPQRAGAAS